LEASDDAVNTATRQAVQHSPSSGPPSRSELEGEVAEVVMHPGLWLDTPNDLFGGRAPREFLDGGDEERALLHDVLQAARFGVPS
jgi:hypothetical protein